MNFECKYGIDDVFYCPRSYERVRVVQKEIDGKVWERQESYFSPEVKIRRIVGIEASVNSRGEVSACYRCETKRDPADAWEEGSYFRTFTDDELDRAYDNYEQAIEKATEYAIHKKREYFG
jgi:hypothetical protein